MHSVAFCYTVRLSVRDKSEHCENGEIGLWLQRGAYWKSPPSYSGDISNSGVARFLGLGQEIGGLGDGSPPVGSRGEARPGAKPR